ncbi:MAG TPA: hypothetical protein VFK71_05155, partial [Gaiellaceae bacterium]|nr:hypothetical protein [Gaiellaceae bacterium]
PDVYGGDELETLALVDPDNRRPVDWDLRIRALRNRSEPKLVLTREALELRARRPGSFAAGYEPVDLGEGVCAFHRGGDVLVAVPVRDRGEPLPGAGWREVVPGLYER